MTNTAYALDDEQFKGRVETIFIEGHTDNVPINNGIFPSNWELSTKRAINTWLVMSSAQPRLPGFKNNKGELIFSVSGYADTRPVKNNTTEAERRKNRRIDIRFSMMSPSTKGKELAR